MSQPGNITDADLIRAIEGNFVAYGRAMTELAGGAIDTSPEMEWVATPGSLAYFNGVIQTRLGADDAPGVIARFIQEWRQRRFVWWVTPSATPTNLGELLDLHHPTRQWRDVGMAARLAEAPDAIPVPENVTIARVATPVARREWVTASTTGFNHASQQAADFHEHFGDRLPLDDPNFVMFLARQDGVPVASCLLFCDPVAAGICEVSVLPQARRQGIGAAITLAAMRAGQARGREVAVLQASPIGQPVYARLGFRPLCALDAYLWEPSV